MTIDTVTRAIGVIAIGIRVLLSPVLAIVCTQIKLKGHIVVDVGVC